VGTAANEAALQLARVESEQCAVRAVSTDYLSPPTVCERTRSLVERCGGSWVQEATELKVDYALPSHASGEVLDYLRPFTSVVHEPDFVATLPGGRVFGPGVVLSPDGRSIARDVSVDFGKTPNDHWALGYRKLRPPAQLEGTTGVIATALGFGYSHWLLEELPRLIALSASRYDRLIAHTKHDFSRAALRRAGATAPVVEPRRYSHYQCDHLLIPSLRGQPGFPTLKLVETLNDFVSGWSLATPARPERLYVSRARARRRRVSNESELAELLAARGFTQVFLEDLSWNDQVGLFRSAKVVVAPHGAGLANLAFCRPGTRVVELFNRAYINGCYWRLSALRGLDYRPVVPPGAEPLGCELQSNRLDLHADLDQVDGALSG
jgi:capsular polysaccharide biosynthesis protein